MLARMGIRSPWHERGFALALAGLTIALAALAMTGSRGALAEGNRVRVLVDSPPPGAPVESHVHQARISGNAVAEGDEPKYYDVMVAIDVSASTRAASGVDVDGDGVVGVNPHRELLPPGSYPDHILSTDPDQLVGLIHGTVEQDVVVCHVEVAVVVDPFGLDPHHGRHERRKKQG